MVDYNQNNKIDSAFKDQDHQVPSKENPINITYGTLDQIFKVLHEEDISVKQIIPTLATLGEDVIASIVKKPHYFVKKKQWTTLKKPEWSWEVTSRFLRRREGRNFC